MSQEFSFMIYTVASTVGAVIVFAIKNINDDDYKYDSSEKKKVKSEWLSFLTHTSILFHFP